MLNRGEFIWRSNGVLTDTCVSLWSGYKGADTWFERSFHVNLGNSVTKMTNPVLNKKHVDPQEQAQLDLLTKRAFSIQTGYTHPGHCLLKPQTKVQRLRTSLYPGAAGAITPLLNERSHLQSKGHLECCSAILIRVQILFWVVPFSTQKHNYLIMCKIYIIVTFYCSIHGCVLLTTHRVFMSYCCVLIFCPLASVLCFCSHASHIYFLFVLPPSSLPIHKFSFNNKQINSHNRQF